MYKVLIISICFYINLSTFGYMRSGGVLYITFIDEFKCTYAQASWPTVLIGSFASFTIFFAGFLTHYFEKRSIISSGILLTAAAIGASAYAKTIQLTIFFSALQGIGIGLFVGLLPIIISENFEEGKSVACGISYSGSTFAAFIFPPLLQTIIEYFNLKIALLILSAVAFSAVICCCIFKSTKVLKETKEKSIVKQLLQDFEVMKLFQFWIVTIIYIVFVYVFVIFIIILPDFSVSRGLDKQAAAILVSIYSIGDFLGRLIPGYLHLKEIISNRTWYIYGMLMMACLFFLIEVYAISFLTLSILCIAIGFISGLQMTLPAVVMVEFIGVEKTTIGFGFSNILSGFIALSRPLLIDYIKETTGTYDYLLIINGVLCSFAILPWFYYFKFKKPLNTSNLEED